MNFSDKDFVKISLSNADLYAYCLSCNNNVLVICIWCRTNYNSVLIWCAFDDFTRLLCAVRIRIHTSYYYWCCIIVL
jgi:hypothetical protein